MVLDVESASRAGVALLLVEGGSSSPDDLRDTGERTLRSLDELLPLLPAKLGRPRPTIG